MNESKNPESTMNKAMSMIAVDSCESLRKISDSGGKLGPPQIVEFQKQLTKVVASVYFGTYPRLSEFD